MKNIQSLLTEVERYKNKRGNLAQKLKDVDTRQRKEREELEARYTARVNNFEQERQSAVSSIESRAKKDVASYVSMKNSLQNYSKQVRQWCPQTGLVTYMPNPSRVNEAELAKLLEMINAQGFMAWVKRTFKLDGFSSRAEMALDLCKKIEDACAFCNERIDEIERKAEEERNKQITVTRHKIGEENENYKRSRNELEMRQKEAKEQALVEIANFDTSSELQVMHDKLDQIKAEAESACGTWGEYSVPAAMPKKLQLCDVKTSLLNKNGVEETKILPVWMDLYESNIVVITSNSGAMSSADSKEKLLVRRIVARMLKTIPPEYCSYSVFDALHKGASLERLIDVMNVGTTDINFDLFTSDERDRDSVTCAERRKYLRQRPAEIIKSMAGRSKTLFEHNQQVGDFEFPFTWYIDFSFPDDPDAKYLEDIKELFVNASVAGYSFVFVATPNGYEKIKELAQMYTNTPLIHIDVEKGICEQGNLKLKYADTGIPQANQIYNFMTALKKYYDEGETVDNRINSVFAAKGIEMRDASKKLTIPMALDSRGRLVDLELGGEGSVHGFISGGTNSGKSTLLHTIILSACLHYHPNDLEIWLVDYKQTEFHLYKKKTPPHIKLIGVSKTADFTFSLLDRIEEEASRRTDLMNRFDVQNLEQYRRHKDEPGYVNIPRLFIVIDEFHEMSQFVAAVPEYKDRLENILREYRAQGITCLLADQTFSNGLSGLTQAAMNQIGLRIAMRNETSPQEIKATLEVDRALYSDSMQRTIALMSQGEFIMKVYVRNDRGELTDIRLEKFKGLWSKGEDLIPIGKALRSLYKGQYTKSLLYVNTKEQVPWDDSEPAALDTMAPIRYPNIRLYLGRTATLEPCFGLDMGRQPDENLSIVGGEAFQRWELISSIMRSCRYRNYKLLVFMAEYSDLMSDFGNEIRSLCEQVPNAELMETTAEWCAKLSELETLIDEKKNTEDIVCLFIGLEIANTELSRLPKERGKTAPVQDERLQMLLKFGAVPANAETAARVENMQPVSAEFDATPIISKLFSTGARNGIRCITEVSVYRQFSKILKIKEMCRHKIAFNMSSDDCMMYLGNGKFQKSIGQNAVYSDGGKEVKKLLPYSIRQEI